MMKSKLFCYRSLMAEAQQYSPDVELFLKIPEKLDSFLFYVCVFIQKLQFIATKPLIFKDQVSVSTFIFS